MPRIDVEETDLTHKDGKPRRRLTRTRLKVNGNKIDLKKLAAKRRLVPRQ